MMPSAKPTDDTIDTSCIYNAVLGLHEEGEDRVGQVGAVLASILLSAPATGREVETYLTSEADEDFQLDAPAVREALRGIEPDMAALCERAISVAAYAEVDEGFEWEDIDELFTMATAIRDRPAMPGLRP